MSTDEFPAQRFAAGPAASAAPVARRRGGRSAILVLGLLTAVVLVVGSAWTTSRDMWVGERASDYPLPAATDRVELSSDIASIEVRTAGPGEVAGLVTSSRGLGGGPVPVVERTESADGRTMSFDLDCSREGRTVLFTVGKTECDVTVELAVPEGAEVDVTSDVGSVELRGLSGPVRATTDVGEIELIDSRSTQVDVTTSVGSVVVRSAVVPDLLSVSADLGSFEVSLPDDGTAYAIERRAGLGTLDVGVPEDPASPHRLRLAVELGDGTVDTR